MSRRLASSPAVRAAGAGQSSIQAHRSATASVAGRRRRMAAAFVADGHLRAALEERILGDYLGPDARRRALIERRRRMAAAFVADGELRADLLERSVRPYLGEPRPVRGARLAARPGRSRGDEGDRGAVSRRRRFVGDGQ